ncbi:MAG: class I SAM-dependent methyltransferase [Elusimicrobia bacterium]|nr:class I SAM-dependent methyltransferase [Candidatus Obscuribacterium magneticum]
MSIALDVEEKIKLVYFQAVDFLKPYITYETRKKMSVLNVSSNSDQPYDFVNYLERSFIRYKRLLSLDGRSHWLEIGALFPALPISLALLGNKVTVVEEFGFYPPEIRNMYEDVQKKFGVKFVDCNFSVKPVNLGSEYDRISLMGVLEHLPYTPRFLLQNAHAHLNSTGHFYLDVPNLFYAPNVLRFLSGKHIQQPIDIVFRSGIPFVGHHREYAIDDLKYVVTNSGFEIERVELFNYSCDFHFRYFFRSWAWPLILSRIKPLRETIFMECRKGKVSA